MNTFKQGFPLWQICPKSPYALYCYIPCLHLKRSLWSYYKCKFSEYLIRFFNIPARLFPSTRFTLATMDFLATLCLYLMRANLSVALVCMTEGDEKDNDTASDNYTTTPYNDEEYIIIEQVSWKITLSFCVLCQVSTEQKMSYVLKIDTS